MGIDAVAGVIKKTVQEANRNFFLSYLDSSGLPHSCFMGFGHLNKNYSVVMIVEKNSQMAARLKRQSWAELLFHTKDYSCVAKFVGTVKLSAAPGMLKKLIGAYSFLNEYYEDSEESCLLVQLQTKLIEVEIRGAGKKWHTACAYNVEDDALVEVDRGAARGDFFEDEEYDQAQFDTVRRIITKRHGDMLMAIINHDFDALANFVAVDFHAKDGQSFQDFKTDQALLFKDLDFSNAEINWGIRNFEQRVDGQVSCRFFLDVQPQAEDVISMRLDEVWAQENDSWCLAFVN